MKRIPLTQGQFALVDDEDFERISAHRWCAHWDSKTKSFRATRITSADTYGVRRHVSMHREVMRATRHQLVDHRFHDTLDNRKKRLRLCSVSQNNRNSRLPSNNTSGFKGVSWYEPKRKWQAYISVNNKQIHLGWFEKRSLAAYAYNTAALQYHGRFAMPNRLIGKQKKARSK